MSSQRQLGTGNKISLEPLKLQCSPGCRGCWEHRQWHLISAVQWAACFGTWYRLTIFLLPCLFSSFFFFFSCFPNSSSIPLHSTQVYTAICGCCFTGTTSKASPPLPLPPEIELVLAMVRAGWSEQPKGIHMPEKNLSTLSVDHHRNIMLWYTQSHQGECRNHHNFIWTSILIRLAPKKFQGSGKANLKILWNHLKVLGILGSLSVGFPSCLGTLIY